MRLIDADALMAHEFKNDISYKAFCNLVKRQPTVAEWIPGKPDTARHVLVTRKWSEDDLEVCEMDYGVSVHSQNFVDNVIAWMPLPEPYKEDE